MMLKRLPNLFLILLSFGAFASDAKIDENKSQVLPGKSRAIATFHVDKDHPLANNLTNTGAADSPWLTIQHGVNQLQPGDTLIVHESEEPYFEPYRANGRDRGGVTIMTDGTAENPITIKGADGERPVIDQRRALSQLDAATGGVSNDTPLRLTGIYVNANYINISNFEIRNTTASGIATSVTERETKYVTIENTHIHHQYGQDNIAAIRLDHCDLCVVRNNILHDTYNTHGYSTSNPYTDEPHQMHAGVMGYQMGSPLIENNTMYNLDRGVFEKSPVEPGEVLDGTPLDAGTIRKNLFYNIVKGAYLLEVMGSNDRPSYRAEFYGNIVDTARVGIEADLYETRAQSSDFKIYNNTFYNVDWGIASLKGYHDVQIYNNLVAKSQTTNFYTVDPSHNTYNNSNQISYFNNNFYASDADNWELEIYSNQSQKFGSFSSWQNAATAESGAGLTSDPDRDSLRGEANFIDPVRRNFQLATNSAARNAKLRDGATGEVGAYGIAGNVGAEVVKSNPPTGAVAQ
jgi:hypothetical protein